MKTITAIFLTSLLALSASYAGDSKVVYGRDSRIDLFETSNPFLLELANSTAAKILKSKMTLLDDGTYELSGKTLGEKKKLCKEERFYSQLTVASCTGFLVAPDLMVTAGHCATSQESCEGMNWVFGFSITNEGDEFNPIRKENVFGCKEIIDQKNDKDKNDYALIRLDRPVEGRVPLIVRTEGKVEDDARLILIGHPTGLPAKIAINGKIRNNLNPIYFVGTTDSFGGNSGSPVINQETGVVEGILVRGDTDYTYDWNAKCRRPYRCPENLCKGEGVTRITTVKSLMELL